LNVVAIVECIVNCLKHILNCYEQDFEDDYNAVIEYANIAYFRRVNFSKIPANITKPNEIVIAIPIELFYRKLKINSKYVAWWEEHFVIAFQLAFDCEKVSFKTINGHYIRKKCLLIPFSSLVIY
jgi:hypothetical protein